MFYVSIKYVSNHMTYVFNKLSFIRSRFMNPKEYKKIILGFNQ